MEAHAHVRHGDVYRWLRENRRAVHAGFKTTGSGWDGVVAALTMAGVTGRGGAPPNRKSVRRVWLRVCADLEVEAAARAASKADKPPVSRSRPAATWQPPLAPPRASARPPDRKSDWLPRPPSSSGERAVAGTDRQPMSKEEAAARIAELKRTFAERSGH
jgi:hypothetical protein